MSDVTPEEEAHGRKVAAAFQKHLDDLYDKFGEGLPDAFYEGFLRAVDEVEVNLHYYVDGRCT